MLKGSKDPHIDALSEHLSLAEGGNGWHKIDNHGQKTNEDSPQKSLLGMEKKRTRNIGSKSKRLLMHSEEAMELRLTWEEAQDLLRPSPSAQPNIVTIEDHEFEEYDVRITVFDFVCLSLIMYDIMLQNVQVVEFQISLFHG